MTIEEVKALVGPQMEMVEALIGEALRSDIGLLDATNKSLREHPGKMMRPMLAILAALASGTPDEDTIRFAAASELLHNATLLHDDVVDGATERRGVPTVAKLLSGSAAVLIGDFWLTRCVQTILDAERNGDIVLRIFAATLAHLAEGELLQMQKASSADTTREDYLRIIYCKTASLFEAAAHSAAISAGATSEHTEAVKAFARNLGIAFQIKDDILDYIPAADTLGKPVGIDLLEQKITQPLLSALEGAPEEAEIRAIVAGLSSNPEKADAVRRFVESRDGIRKATLVMNSYILSARDALGILPPSPSRDALEALSDYVTLRNC